MARKRALLLGFSIPLLLFGVVSGLRFQFQERRFDTRRSVPL